MGLGIVIGMVVIGLLIMGVIYVYNLGFAAGRKCEQKERDER